jgi:phosphomannomutase
MVFREKVSVYLAEEGRVIGFANDSDAERFALGDHTVTHLVRNATTDEVMSLAWL